MPLAIPITAYFYLYLLSMIEVFSVWRFVFFYSKAIFYDLSWGTIQLVNCFKFLAWYNRTRSRVVKNTAKIVQSWKDKKDIG